MKKSFILTVIAMMMLMIVSAVCADDLSDVKQAGVLRFGAPLEYIPFVYQDENDNANGMDIALMQEIARRMGLRLQTLSFARDGIIDALTIGQIDVIGGGLSKTASRAERIDFSRTYYYGEAQVISLASSPKPQNVNPESFRDKKLGVVKGSSFQEWVQKNLVDTGNMKISDVYTYSDSKDGMKALDRKEIDLFMIDQDVYEDRYRPSGSYQVFYTGFSTENYAFGMRKDSTLTQEINNHLNDMMKDGTAQNIADRFFAMDFSDKDKDNGISRPAATAVPIATIAPAASNCVNAMSYVADVTVKDGQNYNPNASFRKTWRVYNNGSCTWDSNYYLDFASGDRMNAKSARVPGTVKPGQTVDISVDMTAPNRAGNYKGYWQMRSPQGASFGQTIWVAIKVSGNAPAPTATPRDGQTRTIPVIDYFYADSYNGKSGDGTTVRWGTTKAGGVTIYVDGYLISNEGANGSYQLQAPLQGDGTHEIKLVAHSVTDDATATIYYTMGSGEGQTRVVPKIDYFYASPDSGYTGDGTIVYWSTSNAGGVTISVDGYQITNEGSAGSYQLQAPIQGTGTHSITLTAHSVTDDATQTIYFTMYENSSAGGGSSQQDGQYQVIPNIDSFSASSYSGYPGDGTTIYWSTSNAGGVTITVDGYQISNEGASGSYSLQAPLQGTGTHSITLTAHSVTDDTSQTIYYTMNENSSNDDWQSGNSWNNNSSNNDSWNNPSPAEESWNDVVNNMTEEDWTNVFDSMTDDEINEFIDYLSQGE